MKGWHKESYRHYLAAKGIKTNRYNYVKFGDIRKHPHSRAWVLPNNSDDIFIGDMPDVTPEKTAEIMAHEELHNILNRDIGFDAAKGLDYIETENREFNIKQASFEQNLGNRLKSIADRSKEVNEQEAFVNSSKDDKFSKGRVYELKVRLKNLHGELENLEEFVNPDSGKGGNPIILHRVNSIKSKVARRISEVERL